MGKGKTGCGLSTMPDLSGELSRLDVRNLFVPQLRASLERILDSLDVIDTAAAQGMVTSLCESYACGDHPDQFMDSFLAKFRLQLALQLDEEEAPELALRVLSSQDLIFEQARDALSGLLEGAGSAQGRSLYRNGLANLYYRSVMVEPAVQLLRSELSDPELSEAHHALAREKLEMLSALPEPVCWEEQLIPLECRDGEYLSAWRQLTGEGLGGSEGATAAHFFARRLQKDGYGRTALEVVDRLEQSQYEPGELDSVVSLRGSLLRDCGWTDWAVSALPPAHHVRTKIFESLGMTDQIIDDFEMVRSSLEGSDYLRAYRENMRRLLTEDRLQDALRLAEGPHAGDTLSPLEAETEAIHHYFLSAPDQYERAQRYQLYRDLVVSDRFREELARCRRQAADSSLSEHQREQADRRLASLTAYAKNVA